MILSKAENYRRWQSGDFGNKLRAWRTVDEWRDSGFSDLVALRYLGEGGNGRCQYDLTPDQVEEEFEKWVGDGLEADKIMLNEMAPGHKNTVQGEYYAGVLLGSEGQTIVDPFLHSFEPYPMRIALQKSNSTSTGLRSREILKLFMTTPSYEDFQELVWRYPNHVLEVSVFERCLGDLPNRNAVVWEVRRY